MGAFVACVVLAGCGGNEGSDREQVRAAVVGLQSALAEGNLDGACSALTSDGRRHIGQAGHTPPGDCEKDLREVYSGLQKGAGLRTATSRKVARIALDGDRATATVALGGETIAVPLAREDGEWKVDALYGGVPADTQEDNFD